MAEHRSPTPGARELSDETRAWLRTVVPGVWAAIVVGAVGLGLPSWITDPLGALGPPLIVPAVLAVLYPLFRKVEAALSPAVTRAILGSAVPPKYTRTPTRHTPRPDAPKPPDGPPNPA